jgi:hypothetical protein
VQERRSRCLFLDGGPVESAVVTGVGEKPARLSAAIFGASSFISLQRVSSSPVRMSVGGNSANRGLVERCRERVLEVGVNM